MSKTPENPDDNTHSTDEITMSNVNSPNHGENDLEVTVDPGANTNWLLKDSHKDHAKGSDAFLFEGPQNSIDAFWHAVSNGLIEASELDMHIRVTPQHNMIEIWDNSGGMTKEKIANNYLKYGNPGDEKKYSDTGGAQGRGSWVMIGWGDVGYIETLDVNGDRWRCKAMPEGLDGNRSPIEPAENPRPELDEPGTYLRVRGLDDSDIKQLSDPEYVIGELSRKFAFALANDAINITVHIDGVGEFTPETIDIEQMFDEGGIVEGEDLKEFTMRDETRQLTDLHLIDHRQVSSSEDPPWKGVAMLKGGEYVKATGANGEEKGNPYLTVWIYRPNQNPVMKKGKLWGWVDASSLCPDLEENGHTGFVGGDIYQKSGLRDRLMEITKNEFGNQTVTEQEQSSREVASNVNRLLSEYDDVELSGSDGKTTKSGETDNAHPNDPIIKCSAGKGSHEIGDKVTLGVTITAPKKCRIDKVRFTGEIEQIRDADGEKLSDEQREETKTVLKPNVYKLENNDEKVIDGKYPVEREGKYKFSVEMRQQPSGGSDTLDFDEEIAAKHKPVISESYSMFTVGEIDTGRYTPSQKKSKSLISEVHWYQLEDKKWRTQLRGDPDNPGQVELWVNVNHPEFEAVKDLTGMGRESAVRTELGTRWGFLRIFMERAGDEILELLDEHNATNSEIRTTVHDIIEERLEEYDVSRYETIADSPLYNN